MQYKADKDPNETREWRLALESVIRCEGVERAQYLMSCLESLLPSVNTQDTQTQIGTPLRNTIRPEDEAAIPGDPAVAARLEACIRWNALAIVMRANQDHPSLGGHISTFASIATLYEVGFNHFFHAKNDDQPGDLVFYQGHSTPGIYARSFLEGRLTEEQLIHFRREVDGHGLSSYPHPQLMPQYWQFPTVSMGLGPIQSIYQAYFMNYMQARGLAKTEDRHVWCFIGDGEVDEPETFGAIGLAARASLDRLIFVINCNLQRLDGPVRGNGKIIQELEAFFLGAGWHVIKVVWSHEWEALIARDHTGELQACLDSIPDGEFQNYAAKGGAYMREHLFGRSPTLSQLVEDMTDEQLSALRRGGHDARAVYAAYQAAVEHTGQPTVILAHTVKGYAVANAEALNHTHSVKSLSVEDRQCFRDHFDLPLTDQQVEQIVFYRPEEDSPEMCYLRERRAALGGAIPQRQVDTTEYTLAKPERFKRYYQAIDRPSSTTMVCVRLLGVLMKDTQIGKQIVPIVPDEARTFGMEGMFQQYGIYAPKGQQYRPVDFGQAMFYREDAAGQILEEGINELGAMSAWLAAATAYSTTGQTMMPFYFFYSMFGFQRIGDLAWAAGDSQAKGFLIGATAGRTTLNGEGLQHQDGHSHILASTIPNVRSYDPAYAYELAVIIESGLQVMYREQQAVFYYITVMNENYTHPALPERADIQQHIVEGMYHLRTVAPARKKKKLTVQLLGAGTILREVEAAAEQLSSEFGVTVDVWSVTSFNELRRDGLAVNQWNLFNTEQPQRTAVVSARLQKSTGPILAATDYMQSYADQIRPWIPEGRPYLILGTDGFGRSDTRERLRAFFQVDCATIVYAALKTLNEQQLVETEAVQSAMQHLTYQNEFAE